MIDNEDRNAIGFALAQSLVGSAVLPDLIAAQAQQSADPPGFIRELREHVSARVDALARTEGNAGVVQLMRPAIANIFDTASELLRLPR